MDLALYFLIAILMAAGTWFFGWLWGYKAKEAIMTIVVLALVVPLLLTVSATIAMLRSDPLAVQGIMSSTVEVVKNYVMEKLPYIVISDIAGIILGRIIGYFTRKKG